MIAEAVVSFVLKKLGDLLIYEGVFLQEVHDQFVWVQNELTWIQAFLKDAEKKQNDARVKKWVEDVRDIAYKAEDVIDKFILKIEQKRRGLVGPIKKTFTRHQLGKEIENIKNELNEISKKRLNYGIKDLCEGGEGSTSMGESLREQRRTSHLHQQTEFVGFQEDIRTLVARLIEGEPRRCVISIVGMGGIGKTTLARKVYNHDAVKKHFTFCAWIYVSQEYNVRELLLNIIRCFMIPTEPHPMNVDQSRLIPTEPDLINCDQVALLNQINLDQSRVKLLNLMNLYQLREMLFKHLSTRKYFIVVDDIWKTEAWDALAATFPDMNNGSRILLTTRNKDIASDTDARSHPHELQFLKEDESWELFCKKIFLEQDSHCPQHLEGVGRQIVAKCHGLPLAVVVIAGLLSRKVGLLSEWEKVLKSIGWQFVEGDANISSILALSYEDLPYHLRSCFLYLGVFPADSDISVKKLIQLWVAEGFVHSRGAETLEEVAEDCLQEIIQRSLIQVVQKSFIGEIKSCRIHDLLRDISISKAKEEKFLHGDIDPLSPCKARRLSVHHGIGEYTSLKLSTQSVRSILCFTGEPEILEKNQQKLLYGCFQLLRVLHLHQIGIKEFPNEIGTLGHLRYLGVTGCLTDLRRLPSSIANLRNLQTLEIDSNMIDVPSDIWKMQQLRHVRMKGKFTGFNAGGLTANKLSFPTNLQTLKSVCAGDWIKYCLEKLVNLRKLGILGVDFSRHGKGLLDSIPKLDHLQTLRLSGVDLNPFLAILNRPCLYKLHLNGCLKKLPEAQDFSPYLTKLTLGSSLLVQDPMTTLAKLTNLRILKMQHSVYMGKEMVCSAQGFPRLQSLVVAYFPYLERWRVEEGAMPSLLHFCIHNCNQLKMLPEGLQHVTALRNLEIVAMCQSFNDRLREEGEDWHKIQHIPSIDIKDPL